MARLLHSTSALVGILAGLVAIAGFFGYPVITADDGTAAPPSVPNRPDPGESLPDLVIEQMDCTSVVVANVGDARAGRFWIDVEADGESYITEEVSGLAPGEAYSIDWSDPAAEPGNECFTDSFTAIADSAGDVVESDEGNNGQTV